MKEFMSDSVLISEVGPRDGLQSIQTVMETQHKLNWIRALAASGLAEIEVGSFVPPKLLPQMADAAIVVEQARKILNAKVMALVPNLHGARAAYTAGAQRITIPVSASEAHSLANVRKTRKDMVAEVGRILAFRAQEAPDLEVEVAISTAFGCTIQGAVAEDEVLELAVQLATLGADEVGLSDTTGYANPAQVKRLFRRMFQELGPKTGAAHMHNTRGLGLANCWAAFEEGVRSFDASMGGIGGCPYAPGASGNVCTEDLVFMFEASGVATGVNLEKLFAARSVFQQGLPHEPIYGMVAQAGLPKTFEK
jgi:hydroxymethylglutaryl-CoA lyase